MKTKIIQMEVERASVNAVRVSHKVLNRKCLYANVSHVAINIFIAYIKWCVVLQQTQSIWYCMFLFGLVVFFWFIDRYVFGVMCVL